MTKEFLTVADRRRNNAWRWNSLYSQLRVAQLQAMTQHVVRLSVHQIRVVQDLPTYRKPLNVSPAKIAQQASDKQHKIGRQTSRAPGTWNYWAGSVENGFPSVLLKCQKRNMAKWNRYNCSSIRWNTFEISSYITNANRDSALFWITIAVFNTYPPKSELNKLVYACAFCK